MKHIRHYLTIATFVIAPSAWAADPPSTPTPHAVRQQFVPAPPDSSGGRSADWTALNRMSDAPPGALMAMAHAGIGDTFPVQQENKPKLFDVTVVSGDDDHLVLKVRSKEGSQRFDVKRDKEVSVEVAGQKYILRYPSVTVSSDSKPTTDKATIIVHNLP